jgi:hypothetical protein
MSTGATPPSSASSNSATLRLSAADFDAYLPERASSNAFTRPRLELKQRMLAWARAVQERLADMGIALEITGSDEHPNIRNGRRVECQRVFFWRDAEARADLERLIDQKRSLAARLGDPAPHKNHAYLAIRLDSTLVEVSVEIHAEAWVDLRNLRARLADPERAIELVAALEALPEQFGVGVAGEAARAEAARVGTDGLRDLLARVEHDKRALWIGWSVPRELAITHAEILATQLEDAIVALGPLFKLIAWAKDNDLVVLDREWDAARAETARAHEEAERDRAEWEARRERQRRRPQDEEHRDERAHSARKPAVAKVEREHAREPAAPAPTPAHRPVLKNQVLKKAARGPRVTDVDPSLPIEKGARVLVLSGPFEGKLGVVQEIDGRGGARVMLGLLAMKLEVRDLVASVDAKDRPVLGTSHRKPLPAR